MAEYLQAVVKLFGPSLVAFAADKAEDNDDYAAADDDCNDNGDHNTINTAIRRLLFIIGRSGALTAIECQQILKEISPKTRLEKLFQILALQDEVRNVPFLKCLRTYGIRAMLKDESKQLETDPVIVEELAEFFRLHSKIDRRGKFPLRGSNFRFQRREQQLVYQGIEKLCKAAPLPSSSTSSDNILWLVGGAGLGTTTLATEVVYDSSFLMDKCHVALCLWLDMQQLSPSSNASPRTSMNAIVSELARLLLGPNQVQALLHDELKPDSPSSYLVTQSLIAKINEYIIQNICTIAGQTVLLVVDSVTNRKSLAQIVHSLCPVVRCLAILNSKVDDEAGFIASSNVIEDDSNNSNKNNNGTVVVSRISDAELKTLLATNLPENDAQLLAAACDGSPLLASLIQSKLAFNSTSPLSMSRLHLDDSDSSNNLSSKQQQMAVQLLNTILDGKLFWRSFLLFEPGEAVDISDLMIIWKCGRAEAENYCRDFCKKSLIRPLIDGQLLCDCCDDEFANASTGGNDVNHQLSSAELKFFCVHSTVYDATLRLAALRLQLTVSESDQAKRSQMRFAIIHHAFIAENGNIESTFHEAVRLSRLKLVEKIISIVESVDYLWKFSDCQLIVLNLADYFYRNSFGFVLEEQNPNNESPVFDGRWLQLFCRLLSSLAKDERRIVAIAKSLAFMCTRSCVATAFVRQVFVYSAAFNSFELILLLLQSSPTRTLHNAFLNSKEPRLGRTALHFAVSSGNIPVTRLLLDAGADVSAKDAAGKAMLTLALEHGHLEVARLIYDRLLLANSHTEANDLLNSVLLVQPAPLISAALSGNQAVMEFVLNRASGLHVTAVDDHQRTALMAAVWSSRDGNTVIARQIIEASPSIINAVDEFGKSALSRAVESSNLPMVELLLEKGADVNKKDKSSRSVIITAVGMRNYTKDNGAIVRLLVKYGANLKAVDKHGRTALMIAAWNGRLPEVDLILTMCPTTVNYKDAHGYSALCSASEQGHTKIVRLLLERGAVIDARCDSGQTALMKSAENSHAETCQLLLENGASVNAIDSRHLTPLYMAIENGAANVVQMFLSKYSADVSVVDKQQETTVLMAAVENGYYDIAKILISRPSSPSIVDARDHQSQTALMMAAWRGDVLLADLLIATGHANLNAAANDGFTPVMMAAKNGHSAVAQLLLEKGAQIEGRSKPMLLTPLMVSACFGHASVGRLLLEHGANPNAQDSRGFTPLHVVAKNGYTNFASMLLCDYNADTSLKDDRGRVALMRAAANGHTAIVKLFLGEHRHDELVLDTTDKHGKPALVKAAENGHSTIVKLLLEAGAVDGVASSILMAAANGHVGTIKLLFDSGKDADILQATAVDALFEAVKNDQEVIVEFLLERGTDANSKDSDGNPALLLAVLEGHTELVRILIDHGALVDAAGEHGLNPLMAASKEGHINIVRHLLRSGANVNVVDDHQNTALTLAAKHKHGKIARLLLEAGAFTDAKNAWGETPLLTAVRSEDLALVRNLLEHGSDINAVDQQGASALLIASWKSNLDMVSLLLDNGADIHSKDHDGYNGLMFAVRNRHMDLAKLFIDRGIDVNRQNCHGYTALSIATLKGDVAFARLLLQSGANPRIVDVNGSSAMEMATKRGNSDLSLIFQSLLQ